MRATYGMSPASPHGVRSCRCLYCVAIWLWVGAFVKDSTAEIGRALRERAGEP